jgi:Leucine-rich repeat (LRR) protein
MTTEKLLSLIKNEPHRVKTVYGDVDLEEYNVMYLDIIELNLRDVVGITNIDLISKMTNLKKLYLDNTNISSIMALYTLHNLEVLSIIDCN